MYASFVETHFLNSSTLHISYEMNQHMIINYTKGIPEGRKCRNISRTVVSFTLLYFTSPLKLVLKASTNWQSNFFFYINTYIERPGKSGIPVVSNCLSVSSKLRWKQVMLTWLRLQGIELPSIAWLTTYWKLTANSREGKASVTAQQHGEGLHYTACSNYRKDAWKKIAC